MKPIFNTRDGLYSKVMLLLSMCFTIPGALDAF